MRRNPNGMGIEAGASPGMGCAQVIRRLRETDGNGPFGRLHRHARSDVRSEWHLRQNESGLPLHAQNLLCILAVGADARGVQSQQQYIHLLLGKASAWPGDADAHHPAAVFVLAGDHEVTLCQLSYITHRYSFPPEDRESGGIGQLKDKLNNFICQYILLFARL